MLSRFRKYMAIRMLGRSSRSVLEERLTYLHPAKFRRLEQALAQVNRRKVPGDFIEFGIALGGSAIVIAEHAKGRRFHGFDVFDMIPPPTSDKDDEKSKQRFDVIKSGESKGIGGDTYYGYRSDLYGDVLRAFERHGLRVDGDHIQLHKGLFEDTWPQVAISEVAFAHLDCDWYDPVKYCLERIADLMSPGGIIVIDDYNDYGGCRTAVDEFRAARPDFSFEEGANPLLVKR